MFQIRNTSLHFLKYSQSYFASEIVLKKRSSRKQRQVFQSQKLCDFKSVNRSQEKKLQGYPYASAASERLKDLKVKWSKWKRKTASEPMQQWGLMELQQPCDSGADGSHGELNGSLTHARTEPWPRSTRGTHNIAVSLTVQLSNPHTHSQGK